MGYGPQGHKELGTTEATWHARTCAVLLFVLLPNNIYWRLCISELGELPVLFLLPPPPPLPPPHPLGGCTIVSFSSLV